VRIGAEFDGQGAQGPSLVVLSMQSSATTSRRTGTPAARPSSACPARA